MGETMDVKAAAEKPETTMWEEPSRSGGPSRRDWSAILLPLMEHPKRWARVATMKTRGAASFYATSIKSHQQMRVPAGEWEAVSRRLYEGDDQGKFAVYARYIGPWMDGR